MKEKIAIFRSFRFKLTMLMIFLMIFSGALSNFGVYEYSLRSQLEQLRDKLMTIAQAVTLTIDADSVLQIPLNPEGDKSGAYKNVEEKLLRVKKLAPSIAYIYVFEKSGKKGIFRFAIDIHPGNYKAELPPAKPGDYYDASRFPELLAAFNGPHADRKIVVDEWGIFLSGYAPIRDSSGNVIAVLGIDMSAEDVYNLQKAVRYRAIAVLTLGVIVSLLLGSLASDKVTSRIEKLTEGIRRISSGDLAYEVKVKGKDEISELARSFNHMAKRLFAAKRSLVNYFYRVVQSLIRALEAKDAYTRGHSDRVAEYSEKIARMMGLAPNKIELLKESALLHDIGKLGIQETVLNKKMDLTEDEQQMIRKHPVIGEKILEPVSLDKEMLAVVRGHHERYDGKGYPDGLAGDKIDIMAAIVAVADSYDAMISHRVYRTDLSLDEALDQLKKNSGLQFNPAVVDAFIKVMEGK